MANIRASPLEIGLKVDHRGTYYKIIDHYHEPNSVIKYIIQSFTTGETKRVFRHEICEASVSSFWSKLTDETIFQFEKENSQSDDDLSQIDIPDPEQSVTQSDEDLSQIPNPEQSVTTIHLESENQSDDDLAQIDIQVPDQEPPVKKPRFKEMPTKDQIEKLAQARVELTTNQQTQWGVRLLRGR